MTSASQELVIAAGMPRSASTWLYNVIRLALDSDPRHAGNFSAGWVGDWENIEQRDCMLMKVHDFNAADSEAAKAVLYSYRDVRDAVASQYRKFGSVASMDLAGRYIEMHEQWMARADYAMRYETMLSDREAVAAEVCRTLQRLGVVDPGQHGAATLSADICRRVAELKYESDGTGNSTYHKTNLFHQEHVTDGRYGAWRDTLKPGFVKQVETRFDWWFEKYNYPTEFS